MAFHVPNPFGGGGIPNPFGGIPNPFGGGVPNPFEGVVLPFQIPDPAEWPQEAKDLLSALIGTGLAPEAGAIITAYFLYLENQAKDRLTPLPTALKERLQPHYDTNLNDVRYAENIATNLGGNAVTVDNHIYFPNPVDLNECYPNGASGVHHLMHELQHCDQYKEHGGKIGFITKYILQNPAAVLDVLNSKALNVHNIHDAIGLEQEAEGKSVEMSPVICPSLKAVPLKSFYNPSTHDNFTTATAAGVQSAGPPYTQTRVEGYVFPTPTAGTIPLKLFFSAARKDNFTTATSIGEQSALQAGYVFARIEGYVYPTQQAGTVPLKLFWNATRHDNFTTATAAGEQARLQAAYVFVRIEGYVYPY